MCRRIPSCCSNLTLNSLFMKLFLDGVVRRALSPGKNALESSVLFGLESEELALHFMPLSAILSASFCLSVHAAKVSSSMTLLSESLRHRLGKCVVLFLPCLFLDDCFTE